MVPTQHPCRVFRRHVRQRRDVVRALYHYRRWIAPGFSSILVAPVYPDVGRHLDIHWDARNLHFAVPAFHPISADDRDVGSEDRNTRSGPLQVTEFTPWLRSIRARPHFTKPPSGSGTRDSDAGMFIRRSPFMEWMTRWDSENHG